MARAGLRRRILPRFRARPATGAVVESVRRTLWIPKFSKVDDDRAGRRADGLHGLHHLGPAKKSKAGRLGTAILFLGLGLCLFAFLAKPVIGYIIEVTQGIPH